MKQPFREAVRDTLKLLGIKDPPLWNIREGDSPVILNFPHSGTYVPSSLYDHRGRPLGWRHHRFNPASSKRAHQVCDWGTMEIYRNMADMMPHATLLSANYSRLVCDLNRTRASCVTENNSEHPDRKIPMNDPKSGLFLDERRTEIHDPYFQELGRLIAYAKQHYGGAILIDVHSFNPTWKGEKREKEAGTIYFEDSPLSKVLNNSLADQLGSRFQPHYPYHINQGPFRTTNAGREISERFGIWYAGIEMRSDLLMDPEKNAAFAHIIVGAVDDILSHPSYHTCLEKSPEHHRHKEQRHTPENPGKDMIPVFA